MRQGATPLGPPNPLSPSLAPVSDEGELPAHAPISQPPRPRWRVGCWGRMIESQLEDGGRSQAWFVELKKGFRGPGTSG